MTHLLFIETLVISKLFQCFSLLGRILNIWACIWPKFLLRKYYIIVISRASIHVHIMFLFFISSIATLLCSFAFLYVEFKGMNSWVSQLGGILKCLDLLQTWPCPSTVFITSKPSTGETTVYFLFVKLIFTKVKLSIVYFAYHIMYIYSSTVPRLY